MTWESKVTRLLSVRLPHKLLDSLDGHAKRRGVTRNRLITQAIEWYLEDGVPEYLIPKPQTEPKGKCPFCEYEGTGKCPTHGRSVISKENSTSSEISPEPRQQKPS